MGEESTPGRWQSVIGLTVCLAAGGAVLWYVKGPDIQFWLEQQMGRLPAVEIPGLRGGGDPAADRGGLSQRIAALDAGRIYRTTDVHAEITPCEVTSCSNGRPDATGNSEIRRALFRAGWMESERSPGVWCHDTTGGC